MNKILVVLGILISLTLTSFDSEARKKFGSRSKGKTQQTQVNQQKQKAPDAGLNQAKQSKSKSKKGLMGGILGGLLAGGLIAAMMGGDFDSFQFMDILMIALVAFILFKLFKMFMVKKAMQQNYQAKAAGHPQATSSAQYTQSGFGGQAQSSQQVPMNFTPDFDRVAFERDAPNHYTAMQQAWNDADFEKLAEYIAPELLDEFKAERAEQTEVNTQVQFVSASIVRADMTGALQMLSVHFVGKYKDPTETGEQPINEVWHLEKRGEKDWLIAGVEELV